MKINTLIAGAFALTLVSTTMNAQQTIAEPSSSEASLAAVNNLAGVMVLDIASKNMLADTRVAAKYQPFYVDEVEYGIKAVKSFGSFVIPITNYLKMVSPTQVEYDKAQMVDKASGKSIFSITLDGTNDTVDMTGTKAGVYILILSNRKGMIHSEEIMIM